jgi:hypothetical protein
MEESTHAAATAHNSRPNSFYSKKVISLDVRQRQSVHASRVLKVRIVGKVASTIR